MMSTSDGHHHEQNCNERMLQSQSTIAATAGATSPKNAKDLLVQEMERIVPLVASTEDFQIYRLAKIMCSPQVIQTEADPFRFLEFCRCNPWEAAKRMVEYWKLRWEIFGPDRFWKRVLDTTGTQALHPACISDAIKSFYLLPPDRNGSIVLFHQFDQETEKYYAEILSEHRNAIMFYGLQLVASRDSSLQNGFILIQVRTGSGYKFYPEAQQTFSNATKHCFPMACKGVHIVCSPRPNEKIARKFSKHVLPFIWKIMETIVPHAEHRTLDFITGSDKQEMREKLATFLVAKFGLHPDNLPELAGGPWNYRHFLESDLAPSSTLTTCTDYKHEKESAVCSKLPTTDDFRSIWNLDDMVLEPNEACGVALKIENESFLPPAPVNFEFSMTKEATKELDNTLQKMRKMEVLMNESADFMLDGSEQPGAKKSRYV